MTFGSTMGISHVMAEVGATFLVPIRSKYRTSRGCGRRHPPCRLGNRHKLEPTRRARPEKLRLRARVTSALGTEAAIGGQNLTIDRLCVLFLVNQQHALGFAVLIRAFICRKRRPTTGYACPH